MRDGRTFLMAAALASNTTLIHYLIDNAEKYDIDINAKDEKGF